MLNSLWQDLRYAARLVRHSPGFSAVIIVCLALGIGPSTATFSLINAALLHPVDVEATDELVAIVIHRTGGDWAMRPNDSVSYPNHADVRDRTTTLSGVVVAGYPEISIRTSESSELTSCAIVSPNYFDVLGRSAMLGEVFHASDQDAPGSQPVVVLGHAYWKERFGGDTGIVGTTLRINSYDFTVIGVMPETFTGHMAIIQPRLWVPTTMMDQIRPTVPSQLVQRNHTWLKHFGRMRPGVTLEQVNDDLAGISRTLAAEYPATNEFVTFSAVPFAGIPLDAVEVIGQIVFLAAILLGLVLLLACSSTAAMQVARATVRRREIAIRMSIGATRGRIVRQLLVESVFIALLAGGLALLATLWTFESYKFLIPEDARTAVVLNPSLDLRLLAFTLLISVATGILFGLTPAWQMSRPDLLTPLKGQDAGGDLGSARIRNVLVTAQFALAVVLLVCAGLFVKGLRHAQALDPGFETKNMVVFETQLNLYGYSVEQSIEFAEDFRARMAEVPGVREVSASRFPPLANASSNTIATPINEDLSSGERIEIGINHVAPGYFSTTNIPLLAGRDITDADTRSSQAVIVVNETLAQVFGGTEKAIGRLLSGGLDESAQIIGVVKNSKYQSLGEQAVPFVYVPLTQRPTDELTFCMRIDKDPEAMLAPIGNQIREINPDLALSRLRTIEEQTRASLAMARASAVLFFVLGALALTLAIVGIYGVVSYSVARRKLEIGVRMALGGQPRDLIVLLVKRGLRSVAVGALLGVAVSIGVTRFLAPLLSGLNPTDAQVFVAVPLILLAVAAIAIYIPARGATRVDPMVVLRYE